MSLSLNSPLGLVIAWSGKSQIKGLNWCRPHPSFFRNRWLGPQQQSGCTVYPLSSECISFAEVLSRSQTFNMVVEPALMRWSLLLATLSDTLQMSLRKPPIFCPNTPKSNSICHLKGWNSPPRYSTAAVLASGGLTWWIRGVRRSLYTL